MISSRNTTKDVVAIAGASSTGFTPHNSVRSQLSLAAEACVDVLRKCGLQAADVDGICGSSPGAPLVQPALGPPEVSWFATPPIPFLNHLANAVGAVAAGLADVVLAYHGAYRLPWNTASSLRDPFRRPLAIAAPLPPEDVGGAVGYAAWASRYL